MTLAQVTKKILISDPFYGLVLMSLNKVFDESAPTAEVRLNGINFELAVNREFWDTLSDGQQVEVIKHELMHICFFHLLQVKEYEDKEIMNIAMDAEVNQYLDIDVMNSGEYEFVDILKEYPGIKEKAGAKYYYDYLKQKGGYSGTEVNNHISWMNGNNELNEINEVQKELIKNQIDYILKEAAQSVMKMRGTIPGELKEYLDKLMENRPPVFNWKAYVRRLLGNADEYVLKNTRKRPSRRFKDAMGTKHRHLAHLLVAVDTSGSVSNEECADFFIEINHICKSGVKVDVAECDAQLHRVYPYKGKFDGSITGRGGTSYKPVVDFYNANRKKYTALVYFTDGYCDLDFTLQGPSVWVITSDGQVQNYPGKTVYIPKKKQ